MRRSSRYWLGVYMIQTLLCGLYVLTVYKAPEALAPFIGVLGLIITTAYGMGGWVNRAERDPEFQLAAARREALRDVDPVDDEEPG